MSENSSTQILLKEIETELIKANVETILLSVRELNLPMYNPNGKTTSCVKDKLGIFNEVDGLVIGSPEYHGSYTGVLKNTLDYLTITHLKDKTIGLVSTSGGIKAGISTLNSLRIVLRSFHANVIAEQISYSKKELNSGALNNSYLKSFSLTLINSIDNKKIKHQKGLVKM